MSTAVAKQQTKAPVVQTPSNEMEFVPFMGEAPIKLSIAIVQQHICVPTRSGHICNASQAIKFMMLCRARKLNPFEGDAYLIGYDTKDGPQFSLITAHQAFLKRAEVHPEYDGMESGVIVRDKDGNTVDREGDFTFDDDVLLGAWATVHFKERKYPKKARLKLGAFKKSYGRWNDDPAGMIVKCAEADALRSSFPTQLGGMYLDDEMPTSILEAASKPTSDPAIPVEPAAANASERMTKRLAKEKPPQQQNYDEIPEDRMRREYAAANSDAEIDRVYTSHCGPEGWCDQEQGELSKMLRDQRVAAIMDQKPGQGEMFNKRQSATEAGM